MTTIHPFKHYKMPFNLVIRKAHSDFFKRSDQLLTLIHSSEPTIWFFLYCTWITKSSFPSCTSQISPVLTLLILLFDFCSIRNSMSYLRQGRGAENRRSVFYTSKQEAEEWELVDAPPKDFSEQKYHPDTQRRTSTSRCPVTQFPAEHDTCLYSPEEMVLFVCTPPLSSTVFLF